MGLFQKITLNTLASFVGRVIGSILALVSIGLITRALGREGFGEYSTVIAYLATFQILADLGLYSLLTREISQRPGEEKNLVSLFFTLRLIAAAFFLPAIRRAIFLRPCCCPPSPRKRPVCKAPLVKMRATNDVAATMPWAAGQLNFETRRPGSNLGCTRRPCPRGIGTG